MKERRNRFVCVLCVCVCSGLLLSYLTRSNLYSISTKKENKNEIQCKQSGCKIFPFTWQKEAATGNDKRNSLRAKKNWHRLRCCWHCRRRHYCQDCRPFDTQRHRHTHEKNRLNSEFMCCFILFDQYFMPQFHLDDNIYILRMPPFLRTAAAAVQPRAGSWATYTKCIICDLNVMKSVAVIVKGQTFCFT